MAARLTTYVVVGIVAATLIAGLIVGAQRDDSNGPVDLIVFNGKVHTGDAAAALAEAVAVRGNQILRVGSNREINRLRRPQTIVVDARGAAVMPGFNDADIQFITGAVELEAVDLLDAATGEEMADRIRMWAEANPDRPWVTGRGWHADPFPAGGPTRQLLDAAVADRPAFLLSYDARSAWLNTKALKLARITRRTPDPSGGVIVKDARTGEPTGLLKGTAVDLTNGLLPRVTSDDRARALRDGIAEAHRNGITSVQDATARAEDFILYDSARRAGELDLRVYSSVTVDKVPADDLFRELETLSSRYPDDPVFKVGGVRIALDPPVDPSSAATGET